AYDELERDGFIVTAAARGCFVAQKDMTRIREDRLMQVEQLMAEAVSLAAACGLGEDELVEMLRMQIRGGEQ
ncbi:MAG: GntR family transcriptional regulator, partial [Candidatus Fimadaptatus sp.]